MWISNAYESIISSSTRHIQYKLHMGYAYMHDR
jgi:hypothetical protein